MLYSAKKRASDLGLPFNLTEDDLTLPTVCPALGIPLSAGRGKRHSGSYSLDRINPALGYVPGNVVVISDLANRIKTNATADQVAAVADWLQAIENEIKYNPMTRIDFLAVHCSATPAGGKHEAIGAADIRRWHREKGWRDIGYHFVIKRDGTVETGRPTDQPGAHEPRINSRSLAVCLVGGAPPIGSEAARKGLGEANFTPVQYASLKTLLTTLTRKHPKAEVLGHRDVPGVQKACPSFAVREWWAANKP